MVKRLVSMETTTNQLPDVVRNQVAANLANPEAAEGASLSAAYVANVRQGLVPSGLGWQGPAVSPVIYEGLSVGGAGFTPEALFDAYSTARTAPAQTFYVSTSGVDTNDGSSGAPFRSLHKAISSANTAGTPTRIYVAAGVYERSRSFYFTATAPTVDVAIIATGGKVSTGTFDLVTPAADATHTSTYSVAVANCDRVVDTKNLNRYGNYTDLVAVATAEQCNRVPGSWALVGGTLYIHRADEAAPTPSNTRVFRNQPFNFLVSSPLNVYMEGFDLEGSPGSAVARVDMQAAGLTASPKAAVFKDCTFKYGGGSIGTATIGFAASSWNGVVATFNCAADANATDGFNYHNGQGVAQPDSITVNCSAKDNGRGNSQSCNGLTYHENCRGIDIAGVYEGNRGGNIRNIDTSRLYAFGTISKDDKGDKASGGGVDPTAIRIDGSSILWAERVKADQPRGQLAWVTGDGTAVIRRRSCVPAPQPDFGPGVFETY